MFQGSGDCGIVTDMSYSSNPAVTPGPLIPSLCESRTINYITHILPQSCLTSSWAASGSSPGHSFPSRTSSRSESAYEINPTSTQYVTVASSNGVHPAEAAVSPFMSFEDWREMMLRRAGQDPQEWRSRKLNQQQAGYKYAPDEAQHAELGEEGEISLDFGQYQTGDKNSPVAEYVDGDGAVQSNGDETLTCGDAVIHRSKDAGKTCKERFSYSSFDAGATVLKSSAGAKNARAILVENKDTYMLLECAVPSKYVIVELSDDILIDTVVLANFEFFSSMIRHFRVSVSDRYPIKLEKWRELGVFEARNSRDIQPFLVKNPQIWAKYIRIEFLTHYGNEYYCPVSLLRVHGSRMLDSWKDSETGRDEDLQTGGQEAGANLIQCDMTLPSTFSASVDVANTSKATVVTPWMGQFSINPFDAWASTCPASGSRATHTPMTHKNQQNSDDLSVSRQGLASAERQQGVATPLLKPACSNIDETSSTVPTTALSISPGVSRSDGQSAVGSAAGFIVKETTVERSNVTATPTSKTSTINVSNGKPRISATNGPSPASPMVQEGFFNAITKRLQQVELNLTLSLRYVEEQSRHVQETLQRGEQKQQSKVDLFLDNLNQTVLSELHNIREQYDQIWQSTVLALDSQADRYERDVMALSARLNLLADEVVFQKRMAILQAVILLSCLFLVIFSRGVPVPSIVPLSAQTTASALCDRSPDSHQHMFLAPQSSQQRHDALKYTQSMHPPEAGAVPVSHDSSTSRLSVNDNATCTEFRQLSPPLDPGLPDQSMKAHGPAFGRDPRCGLESKPPRSICLSQMTNPRKPLPSLPEHPVPSHEP